MNLIIADDHFVVRFGFKNLLKAAFSSLKVVEAIDAAALLKEVLHEKFDVIVLDMHIPGRSGLELIRELKHCQPDTPILIFSGQAEEQYALRALKEGASGFLSKSSPEDEIVTAVNTVAKGKKYITSSIAERILTALERPGNTMSYDNLTTRELEVMRLIGGGNSVSQIAKKISLAITTVSTYRAKILGKLGLSSNAQITRFCIENNIT